MAEELLNINDSEGFIQPEEWKPIPEYDGIYEVSSLGRVRSLPRRIYHKAGGSHWLDGRIMRQFHSKQGYEYIVLKKGDKPVRECVHRLVAKAFIPNNVKERNHIDHIDGNKSNNCISNLRWVTRKENDANPISVARYESKVFRPVIRLAPDGSIKEYTKIKDVEEDGFNRHKVCACCRGDRIFHGGCVWVYKGTPLQDYSFYVEEKHKHLSDGAKKRFK